MKITQLTPDLLRRYAAGLLTPAEQHAVERRLLDDPLAAAAVEGLARLREDGVDSVSATNDLRARLRQRVEKRQGRVIVLAWTRYAAAAAVLVGVVSLTWWTLWSEKPAGSQPEIVQKTAKMPPAATVPQVAPQPIPPLPALAKAESKKARPQPAAPDRVGDLASAASMVQTPPPADTTAKLADEAGSASPNQAMQAKRAPMVAARAAAPVRGGAFVHSFSGQVVGENQQPVLGATVQVVGANRGATTDAEGRFSIPNLKPGDRLRVATVGYQPTEITIRDTALGVIALVPDNAALAEVVVTGYGPAGFAPEGGFDSLKTYFQTARNVVGKARIRLSFDLRANGRPHRIRVEESSNPVLNAEAIRLLESGPRWHQNKTTRRARRVVYTVEFD